MCLLWRTHPDAQHVGMLGTGWPCRRTFAQSFCGRIAETSLQTTIRLCSMPSRSGGMPEFGGCQQSIRAEFLTIPIDQNHQGV